MEVSSNLMEQKEANKDTSKPVNLWEMTTLGCRAGGDSLGMLLFETVMTHPLVHAHVPGPQEPAMSES